MKKIKVIHVYKDFNVYNGLTEILTILAKNIDHDKFDLGVCVFRYEGNSFGNKFEELGGKIYNLNIPKKIHNNPREFLGLYKFFKSYKPDVVQTHVLKSNLYGILAAKLAHVPVIIGTEMTLKDTAPSLFGRIRDKFIHPLLSSTILRNCDVFMVTSKFIEQQWYQHKYSDKFKVIYPPFNLEKHSAAANAQITHETNGVHKIGFVGRLSEEKGLHTLLHSMVLIRKKLPDARLVIVGTGPLETELMELAKALHLNSTVQFVGFKENVFETLRQLDVFVLSSRTEGCPMSVLEAMTMGLPVVATNVGGNPELVRDQETGVLVPYNNPEKMALAMVDLLQNKEKARMMGMKGKERAFLEFHPSKFVNKLENLYCQLHSNKILE